ncbi:MAG: peptidylprolyl isomerase, partial [Acidobacteriaceae bacterium]|nr:peptidylprolyl isomerase [Acidobacteriaceae bacterium]
MSRLCFRAVLVALAICAFVFPAAAQTTPQQAVFETTAGAFVIDLLPDAAPNHVANFLALVRAGAYDGTVFHRVVRRGMVQGGDPLSTDPSKRSQYGTGGLNMVKAEARAPKMTRGSVAAVMVPGKPDSAGA